MGAEAIEQGVCIKVELARELALDEARALRDRVVSLVKQLEENPGQHPPSSTGALPQAAELELRLRDWQQAIDARRMVRALLRSSAPSSTADAG